MMTKQPRFSVFPPITLNPRSTFTRLACDVSALSLTCDECLPRSLSAHKAILSRSRLVMNILPALNQLRQGKNTEKAGPACRGNWWRMRYRMRHLIERLQEIYCYRMRHLIKRLQEIYYTTEWDILYQKIARNILYYRMRHLIKRLHEIYHYWMRHLITKDGKMPFFPTWCFWWKNSIFHLWYHWRSEEIFQGYENLVWNFPISLHFSKQLDSTAIACGTSCRIWKRYAHSAVPSSSIESLTHWGRVMHICVSKLSAWTAPSHYLNQCWNIVNWTFRNKLQWNFNRNSNIFIKENVSSYTLAQWELTHHQQGWHQF